MNLSILMNNICKLFAFPPSPFQRQKCQHITGCPSKGIGGDGSAGEHPLSIFTIRHSGTKHGRTSGFHHSDFTPGSCATFGVHPPMDTHKRWNVPDIVIPDPQPFQSIQHACSEPHSRHPRTVRFHRGITSRMSSYASCCSRLKLMIRLLLDY